MGPLSVGSPWNMISGILGGELYLSSLNLYYSNACSINLGSSVILTGSSLSPNRVSEYSVSGFTRDLPQLLTGRSNHGCSYFENEQGTRVDILIVILVASLSFRRSSSLAATIIPTSPPRSCWWRTLPSGSILESFQLLVVVREERTSTRE